MATDNIVADPIEPPPVSRMGFQGQNLLRRPPPLLLKAALLLKIDNPQRLKQGRYRPMLSRAEGEGHRELLGAVDLKLPCPRDISVESLRKRPLKGPVPQKICQGVAGPHIAAGEPTEGDGRAKGHPDPVLPALETGLS